jgi:5-(carboxyamino)imidazole ribonucleotide synthase
MATIGILGGGQLARMLALAGAPLGQRFLVVDSVPDACASQVAPLMTADWRDFDALAEFARRIDVATFDFENVPADTAHWLTEHTRVYPNPEALGIAQDRLAEKNLFREIGLATPAFAAVDSREDLARAIESIGLPAVLKTRRLGYDGKGQRLLSSFADLREDEIAEEVVNFRRELSILAVRSRTGETAYYPLVENTHRDGILRLSLAPAADAPEAAARDYASRLLDALGYVGVLALELFELDDGRLLANEVAPRVHNSGHWTIEGARTSQFENHLRAILGLPLGSTETPEQVAMVNLIGSLPRLDRLLAIPGANVHLYAKEPRPGRKLGHVTLVGAAAATAEELLAEA